jgi:hypothetical protein
MQIQNSYLQYLCWCRRCAANGGQVGAATEGGCTGAGAPSSFKNVRAPRRAAIVPRTKLGCTAMVEAPDVTIAETAAMTTTSATASWGMMAMAFEEEVSSPAAKAEAETAWCPVPSVAK